MSAAEGVTLAGFLAARLDEDEAAAKAQAQRGTVVMYTDGEPTQAEAEYFATISPARVLREVEAKRRILSEHTMEPGLFPPSCSRCYETNTAAYPEEWEPLLWPCPTVRDLAAVYSDHPGYDPRWKPE